MCACTRFTLASSVTEILSLTNVRAGYGETVVLEDIDLKLPEHGALAVLGRNGVGKTTLMATIMGHTTFHSGEIVFNRESIVRRPVYERSNLGIGYVPQERLIFPSLTVQENLDVARRPGRWTEERVYDLFPRLRERRAAMGNQLSGGEQQMLAIGRALIGNPSLLLMDEPLEGLAPIIVEALLKALRKLISEDSLAVVLVEQHAKLALEVTQHAMVLNRGRVSYSGPSAELLADAQRLTSLVVSQ
jgi:branched-chain amino acid transport system ATP-binding protein